MKPRNREINIFNLSMMDVICGALGAFLIMLVVLIPYYKQGVGAKGMDEMKKLKDDLEQTRRQLEQAQSKDAKPGDASEQLAKENQELKKQIADARQQLEKNADKRPDTKPGGEKKAEEELKKLSKAAGSVLMVTAFWDNPNIDLDLWVKYSSGVWEGPKRETPDGKKLIHQFGDAKRGPGFETFTDTAAGGKYEVYYRIASNAGGQGSPISVHTRVSWLGIGAEKYGADHWSIPTKHTVDGRVTPVFAITWDKGEMKINPLGAQR
jgi:hypothetical protein